MTKSNPVQETSSLIPTATWA